jgi:hypothetical protein
MSNQSKECCGEKSFFKMLKKVLKNLNDPKLTRLIFLNQDNTEMKICEQTKSLILFEPKLTDSFSSLKEEKTKKIIEKLESKFPSSDSEIIYKAFKVKINGKKYILVFRYLNTNDFKEYITLNYEDDKTNADFLIDFAYEPDLLFVFDDLNLNPVKIKLSLALTRDSFDVPVLKKLFIKNNAFELLETSFKIANFLNNISKHNLSSNILYDKLCIDYEVEFIIQKKYSLIVTDNNIYVNMNYLKTYLYFENLKTVFFYEIDYILNIVEIINDSELKVF